VSKAVCARGIGEVYVVPVSLTLLQGSAWELEGSDPSSCLLGVLGERKLALVAVP